MSQGLPRQTVPILLRGLDEKQPRQTGVTGALDVLQNMMLQKASPTGGYEFVQRPGTAALSKTADSGSISTGMRLGTLGAGLVLLTGTSCYRKAIDEWHLVAGATPTVGVDTNAITMGAKTVTSSDTVYANGYRIDAYTAHDPNATTEEVRLSVVDGNGVAVRANERIAFFTGATPYRRIRLAATSNRVGVFFYDSAFTISLMIYDLTNPTAAPISVSVTGSGTEVYDVQTVGNSGTFAVCWIDNVTGQLNQRLVTASTGVMSATTAYASLTNLTTLSYLTNSFSSNTLYIAHVNAANGLRVTTFDGTTLALGSTTVYDATVTGVVDNITGYRTGASVSVYFTPNSGTSYNRQIKVSTGGAATVVIRSLAICSRAVSFGGNIYVLARYIAGAVSPSLGKPGNQYFLFDLTNGVVVGKAHQGEAIDPPFFNVGDQYPNLAASVTSSTLLTAGLRIVAVESGGGTFAGDIGASAISFTMQDATVGKPVELNGVLHIPGAQPYIYDGATVVEQGFPIPPETMVNPVFAGGGGMTQNVSYSYRLCDEWIDAAGNLWRSTPSEVLNITTGPGQSQITWAVPTTRVTRKTGIRKGIYRTLANGDGSVYYKVSSVTTPTMNDTTVDTVTFVDNVSDAQAASGEPLYSPNNNAGSVLPNIALPGCRTMAIHRGRLLVARIEGDVDAIWFSKEVTPGFGVEFNDALVSRITSVEPITAIGTMDSYAVACTATQTWGSTNDYPDDTGNGGVLIYQQLSGTTGCATVGLTGRYDLGTIVYTGSIKGVWRMSRGISFDYVGSQIETDVASLATPVAILPVPLLNQIRVVSGSTVLVYESLYGQWAKWTYAQMPAAIVDAVVSNGVVYYLCADGTVVAEVSALIDDAGVAVPHVVTLSGLNLAEVAGFWRLYITQATGRVIGSAGFTLRMAQTFDGVAGPTKSMVYVGTETELNVEADPGTFGKSSRFNLSISDAANGANSSFTLAAVTALVGMKKGLSKLPPARRAT